MPESTSIRSAVLIELWPVTDTDTCDRHKQTEGYRVTQHTHTHTHTHLFNSTLSGTTQVSRTRKVKPIWILLEQEKVSGSGISWAICKSAPRSRQITMPAPHYSFFKGRMPFLPPNQQCQALKAHSVTQVKMINVLIGNYTTDLYAMKINTIHVQPLYPIKILILSSHRNLTPEQ